MRTALLLIISLAITVNVDSALQSDQINKDDVFKFIEGFINGAGLSDFFTCVDQILESKIYNKWYQEVVDVIVKIKSLTIHDWKQIQIIITELGEVLKSIYGEAIECFKGSKELIALLKEILAIDPVTIIPRMIKEIIMNRGKLFEDLMGIIESAKKGEFYKMGFDIADFINHLLFKMVTINPASEAYQILKGILLGLKQDEVDVEELLECVGDVDYIVESINDGIKEVKIIINDIKKFNFEHLFEIIKAFEMIFTDLRQIFVDMEPCAQSNKDIMKIIAIFKGKSAKEIAERIAIDCIKNAYGVFTDIKDAINYFETGRYIDFGMKVGDVLYKCFLQ